MSKLPEWGVVALGRQIIVYSRAEADNGLYATEWIEGLLWKAKPLNDGLCFERWPEGLRAEIAKDLRHQLEKGS